MRKEMKICLPVYKVLYSAAFIVILSIIRGISRISEIGLAMEPPVGLLALVFCADTYWIEIQSKRAEVFKLCPLKKQAGAVRKRLAIQMVFLTGCSAMGYGMFYWQKPMAVTGGEQLAEFLVFLAAITVTIMFWGTLSMTICNIFRNIWAGIGCTLFLWMTLNSQAGDRILGKYNIFSYTFRDSYDITNLSWLWGKSISLLITLALAAAVPLILKKREAAL